MVDFSSSAQPLHNFMSNNKQKSKIYVEKSLKKRVNETFNNYGKEITWNCL